MDKTFPKFNNPVDQLWFEIQDIIGPAKNWPEWIFKLFFTRNLDHSKRPLICAFVIFNGLNTEVRIILFFKN